MFLVYTLAIHSTCMQIHVCSWSIFHCHLSLPECNSLPRYSWQSTNHEPLGGQIGNQELASVGCRVTWRDDLLSIWGQWGPLFFRSSMLYDLWRDRNFRFIRLTSWHVSPFYFSLRRTARRSMNRLIGQVGPSRILQVSPATKNPVSGRFGRPQISFNQQRVLGASSLVSTTPDKNNPRPIPSIGPL